MVEEIINTINNIKAGAIFRLTYKTEVTSSAKFKDIKVYKIVSQSVRTGVDYNNIEEVKEMREEKPATEHKSYCHPIVVNRIYEHNTNGTLYFRVAKVNNHANTTVSYIMVKDGVTTEITEDEAKTYTRPSAWKISAPAIVKNIKLENVISIA